MLELVAVFFRYLLHRCGLNFFMGSFTSMTDNLICAVLHVIVRLVPNMCMLSRHLKWLNMPSGLFLETHRSDNESRFVLYISWIAYVFAYVSFRIPLFTRMKLCAPFVIRSSKAKLRKSSFQKKLIYWFPSPWVWFSFKLSGLFYIFADLYAYLVYLFVMSKAVSVYHWYIENSSVWSWSYIILSNYYQMFSFWLAYYFEDNFLVICLIHQFILILLT